MFENYFIQLEPVKAAILDAGIDPDLAAATQTDKQRLSAPTKPRTSTKVEKAQAKWEALNTATLRYQQKHLSKIKKGNRKNHQSLLDNVELQKLLFMWAASQVAGHVTPITFRQHVIDKLFPQFNIQEGLSCSASTCWMIKLGYRPQEYQKCLYFDGHKQPNVFESRKKYIKDFLSYWKRSRVYGGDDLEDAAQVNPEALGNGKETVFIFHDKSTVHAKEKPKSSWLLPGSREIREKNAGRLIHISDFILETTGRLKLPEEQAQALNLESNDAATVIYPGSNGDKWWDMEQLCDQVSNKAIPIFESLHPDSQAIFVFDCSSAHGAFSKTALRAANNLDSETQLFPLTTQSSPIIFVAFHSNSAMILHTLILNKPVNQKEFK
ncbi:uncharacterized protein PGTG_08397 [Puccinia graminis f. sp. tritici CRL 75-36-700-3]|uniref:DDE-1 domain-containing protein n=1 Tax=Puccinia graminis f. sp. tritici (strain CRL 75-36-700-3 / race SCCL) TaxID=418459 RepID=E3KDK5_PUCGT|nr:uncharacterized protein PGTG_08397 [Puccinia graminis f. sp. tritici CRL 75-36-700-3]EFP82441.2 hypothetical protein PGTG_08397 [Puccinia graminis f. sp. tritici CRL 75-36-700-3]